MRFEVTVNSYRRNLGDFKIQFTESYLIISRANEELTSGGKPAHLTNNKKISHKSERDQTHAVLAV